MTTLCLPDDQGGLTAFTLSAPRSFAGPSEAFPRVAYAAAHVVPDPRADYDPWIGGKFDWDRTIAYRRYLWSLGLGVAEAMDTAQRGMGLNWDDAKQLIRHSIAAASEVPGALLACGAGTDHLLPGPDVSIDDVIRAYEHQCEAIEQMGGRIILMASRALVRAARSPADYVQVYGRILRQLREPAIIHWLGAAFDPALEGYWGHAQIGSAMRTVLDIIAANEAKVDGIKLSLLDAQSEIVMRRRLPASVRMYSGDDFNYPELIAGDGQGHSDALLGIFDPIAPAVSAALGALGRGDVAAFRAILAPTVPLSRHIFQSPTRFYKTGIVFMAWLNGHQDHFVMFGGQQSARSIGHFAKLFRLADAAGLLTDPDRAAARMSQLLAIHGVV